jgi:hypothetical protein
MDDRDKPIPVGTQVRWIKGSRLAGTIGWVTDSIGDWSFVRRGCPPGIRGCDAQSEYTPTALLEPYAGPAHPQW